MMRFLGHISLLLLLLGSTTPGWTQAGGDQLAAELNNLRQQHRQLQRNAEGYLTSIQVLRGNGNLNAADNPALLALEQQLARNQQEIETLEQREREITASLGPSTTAAPVSSTPQVRDPDAEEVARLKALLKAHYADVAAAAAAEEAEQDAIQAAVDNSGPEISAEKVRLNGAESIAAIQQITQRLNSDSLASQRREMDIIFHIEVRRDGKLVSSSSHSLKSLGKAQYISKIALKGGDATVTVRKDSWILTLDGEEAADYLITLNMPRFGDAELHVIPVDELKATRWAELPPWLPYIGTIAPAQS